MSDLLDPADSLRVPGRLVANPTQAGLTQAFPHGGTSLGLVRAITFRPGFMTEMIDAEEFGGQVVETVQSGQSPILACVLVGMSDEMLQRIFPETFAGGSGTRGVRLTSATVAGRLGSAQGFPLLFAPRDVSKHFGLIMYNAVPVIEETAEVPLNTEENVGMAVLFRGLPDATKRTYEKQKLAEMTV